MNEQELKGAMNSAVGAVEKLVGRVTGDIGLEAVGAARQAGGELQARAGKAQAMIGDVADLVTTRVAQTGDQATTAVARIGGDALDAYDRASARARNVGRSLAPYVKQRPYAALGIAAVVGVVIGLMMIRRGPKIVVPARTAA